MKKTIITIGGLPGSGKSSTADAVANALDYQRFSSGDFWRQVAHQQNLSVEELNKKAESDPSIDKLVDETVRDVGKRSNIVVDSRLAFHWIPEAFKVYLKLDGEVAAARIYSHLKDVGRVGQTGQSVTDVYEKTMARIESECKRYEELYGVNYLDEKEYDLVVDTGQHTLSEVATIIIEAYQKWLAA